MTKWSRQRLMEQAAALILTHGPVSAAWSIWCPSYRSTNHNLVTNSLASQNSSLWSKCSSRSPSTMRTLPTKKWNFNNLPAQQAARPRPPSPMTWVAWTTSATLILNWSSLTKTCRLNWDSSKDARFCTHQSRSSQLSCHRTRGQDRRTHLHGIFRDQALHLFR